MSWFLCLHFICQKVPSGNLLQIQPGHLQRIFPLNLVIFHSSVELPAVTSPQCQLPQPQPNESLLRSSPKSLRKAGTESGRHEASGCAVSLRRHVETCFQEKHTEKTRRGCGICCICCSFWGLQIEVQAAQALFFSLNMMVLTNWDGGFVISMAWTGAE